MADRYIHVRYGDSPDAEFVALIDEELPLQDTLPKHLQTAIERKYIPDTFSMESYSLLRDGRRIDLRQPLSREFQRNGHSESPWIVVDDRAPQLLQVAARVDGVNGPRSHVLTKTITPSRLAPLSEAIKPSELFPGSQLSGRVPKRWRVRAAWPERLWLPWGRWKTQVKDLKPNQVVEVGPSLREWRCYKRALVRIGVGLACALALVALVLLTGFRQVQFDPVRVPTTVEVGRKVFTLPLGKAVTKWVPRGQSVLVLPEMRPITETRRSRISAAVRSDSMIEVTFSCYERGGLIRCAGATLLLNGKGVGDLGGSAFALSLRPGLYVIEPSGCEDWDMVSEIPTGVVAQREVRNGRNMLHLMVPPDSTRSSRSVTISIHCRGTED